MLSTMRKSWLLFTLAAFIALSSALSIEEALHIDGIEEYLHQGMKRQASGTGNSQPPSTDDSEPTSTPPPPSSNPPPESTPAPTPTPDPSSDEPESTPAPSSNPPPTSGGNRPTSNGPNSTPVSTPAPSSSLRSTQLIRTTPLVATSVQEFTIISTIISDGQSVGITLTSSSTALITTGEARETLPPETQGSGGGSGGGLSDDNKKIIGGVVGGVGGALLLGGIAIVCWRIWGRKNRVSEDDDDLMAGTGSALGDKPQNNNSPFQSNLEQYHNPGGRPNAAANF